MKIQNVMVMCGVLSISGCAPILEALLGPQTSTQSTNSSGMTAEEQEQAFLEQQRKAFLNEQPRVPANNPLNGKPITEVLADYTPWEEICTKPFKNPTNYITATASEICLRTTYIEVRRAFETVQLEVDGDTDHMFFVTDTGETATFLMKLSKQAAVVSECTNNNAVDWRDAKMKVWQAEYRGCTPNAGVLTRDTRTLALRFRDDQPNSFVIEQIKWSFDQD